MQHRRSSITSYDFLITTFRKKTHAKSIIVGATSGIGKELALQLLAKGWELGIAGRRTERLEEIKAKAPEKIRIRRIDVRSDDAASDLLALIADLGGMDLYVHCSGIGCQNMELNPDAELNTVATNVDGFVRLVDCAFSYFLGNGGGHLCIISRLPAQKASEPPVLTQPQRRSEHLSGRSGATVCDATVPDDLHRRETRLR